MLSERTRTRIEHAIDTRSVRFGAWLVRRTKGGATRLWHRRAIVLTTVGRRTGRPRTVLVQAFGDGDDLLVVAANSGTGHPPGWYFNLLAQPAVLGELDGALLHLRAVPVPESERERCWREVVLATAPDYAKYERRLGRVPPMFRLVTGTGPSDEEQSNG
ncbi:nitroreductase/quinone reductase family protein [Rothia sp. ARF10]|nr:nitroreductase/quinone reductase family protein [Rothia sp. ARF10]